MKKLKLLFLFAFLLLISSCATIVKGTKDGVTINSKPDKAKVTITDATGNITIFNGTTPAVVQLSKKNQYLVNIELDGYQISKVYISQDFEKWTLCNIVCGGGLIGLAIDYVTGAMWKLNPSTINVNLTTAMVDGEEKLFTMFYAKDDNGQLRYMSVPLIKK